MIMNKKMTSFNVEMYNNKMAQLNEIIDTLNNTIYSFNSWGYEITPTFIKKLIANPAEMYHRYLSFEYIAQRKCAEHGIKDKDYLNPRYQDCFHDIIDEMGSILEAHNKFCKLLPYIKETYGSLYYIMEEDGIEEAKIVKTKNAEWRIMQQCTEYTDTDCMD